ncbi:MAG: response regulator [Deltaproteobacteria bacterium]|nr:response regulator [Deltaproteobacteria bacterium]
MDDSPAIRRHVVQKLEPMGFHLTEASSGEEALALTLEHTFDLVVSDIEMGAITGVQLCRVFRGDPGMADVAFVLLTAAKEAKTRFWGRNAGADVYLAKEDMEEKLLPVVEELMKGRTPRDSVRPELTGTPLERVSAVLDHHLFDVVVQSEVRRLMDHVHDRIEFADKVLARRTDLRDSRSRTMARGQCHRWAGGSGDPGEEPGLDPHDRRSGLEVRRRAKRRGWALLYLRDSSARRNARNTADFRRFHCSCGERYPQRKARRRCVGRRRQVALPHGGNAAPRPDRRSHRPLQSPSREHAPRRRDRARTP